jgi:hypothetical protein
MHWKSKVERHKEAGMHGKAYNDQADQSFVPSLCNTIEELKQKLVQHEDLRRKPPPPNIDDLEPDARLWWDDWSEEEYLVAAGEITGESVAK